MAFVVVGFSAIDSYLICINVDFSLFLGKFTIFFVEARILINFYVLILGGSLK